MNSVTARKTGYGSIRCFLVRTGRDQMGTQKSRVRADPMGPARKHILTVLLTCEYAAS
jgi:hypothetical protein